MSSTRIQASNLQAEDHSPVKCRTLVSLLEARAQATSGRCRFSFTTDGVNVDASLTCRELWLHSCDFARQLRTVVSAGDRVLINLEPGVDFVIAFFGCLCAGVVAVPVAPGRRCAERLDGIVADCSAAGTIISSGVECTSGSARFRFLQTGSHDSGFDFEASAAAKQSAGFVRTDASASGFAGASRTVSNVGVPDRSSDGSLSLADHRSVATLKATDLCMLQYTSGSTSDPKGVMLTHANILHNLQTIAEAFGANSESCGVIWLPPFHDMGLIGGLLVPLFAGFPVYLMSPQSFIHRPQRWLRAVSHFKATISGGPTFAWEQCTRRITDRQIADLDLSTWSVAFCGAEPIRANVLDQFAERFSGIGFARRAFYPCYGLAESTLMVTGSDRHHELRQLSVDRAVLLQEGKIELREDSQDKTCRLTSCGVPRRQDVRIVDADTGQVCSTGTVGEIQVSGPSVATGYWSDSALSTSTFGNHVPGDSGTYLKTGDLGAIWQGQLYVLGRIKDLLIVNGTNIPAEDIEDICVRSHNMLRAGCCAAIVGVDGADQQITLLAEVPRKARRDEMLAATLAAGVAVRGAFGTVAFTVQAVRDGSLPRTSSGKLRRRECRMRMSHNALETVDNDRTADSLPPSGNPVEGRDLLKAIAPFATESLGRSWYELAVTVVPLLLALALTAIPSLGIAVRTVGSVCVGLLLVRLFIIYHDYQHGAIFRKSPAANWLMGMFGVFILSPPRSWRYLHNFHHARNSQFATSEIGSFPVQTTVQYASATRWQRVRYRLARSTAVVVAGYPCVFVVGFCLKSIVKQPRRYWDSAVAILVHIAALIALGMAGWSFLILCYVMPLWLAMMIGTYLFYVQHNFPDVKLKPRKEWCFEFAALHSSSYLDVHPVLHWLTGNIGYHHIHHLNSRVPFYRLPEVFEAIPELQHPGRTNLTLPEILRCLRLKLWDAQENRMITFREFHENVSRTNRAKFARCHSAVGT
jgi:acyl-CoA synthetase (AMP-forming)/AMP-acid ligase II/fatty acid desaturase